MHGGVVLLDEAGGDHVARQLLRRSAHLASCERRGRRGAVAGCAKELCYAEIAGSGKEALNIVTKPRGLPLPSPHFLDQPSPSMFVNG